MKSRSLSNDLWMEEFIDSTWMIDYIKSNEDLAKHLIESYRHKAIEDPKLGVYYLFIQVSPFYIEKLWISQVNHLNNGKIISYYCCLESGSTLLTKNEDFGKLWIIVRYI